MNNYKEEIKADLVKLPEVILQAQNNLLLKRKEKDELDLNINLLLFKKSIELEKEYEETKNKELSNIQKRDLKAKEALEKDSNYIEYVAKSDKLDNEIKEDSIRLEFYKNKFKSARSLALLIGDEK